MSRKKIHISELNLKKVGHRIALLRLEEGLTQDQFAKITGLSKSNVSGIENHKYEPSFKAITKIVGFFKVNPEWILFGIEGVFKFDQEIQTNAKKTGKEKEINSSNPTKIAIGHQGLIKPFQNKEKARKFNKFLIEIEKSDPEGYEELYRDARTIFKTLKRMKQKKTKDITNKRKKDH